MERTKFHCLSQTFDASEGNCKHQGYLTYSQSKICLRGSREHTNEELCLHLGKKFSYFTGSVTRTSMHQQLAPFDGILSGQKHHIIPAQAECLKKREDLRHGRVGLGMM